MVYIGFTVLCMCEAFAILYLHAWEPDFDVLMPSLVLIGAAWIFDLVIINLVIAVIEYLLS